MCIPAAILVYNSTNGDDWIFVTLVLINVGGRFKLPYENKILQ